MSRRSTNGAIHQCAGGEQAVTHPSLHIHLPRDWTEADVRLAVSEEFDKVAHVMLRDHLATRARLIAGVRRA